MFYYVKCILCCFVKIMVCDVKQSLCHYIKKITTNHVKLDCYNVNCRCCFVNKCCYAEMNFTLFHTTILSYDKFGDAVVFHTKHFTLSIYRHCYSLVTMVYFAERMLAVRFQINLMNTELPTEITTERQ